MRGDAEAQATRRRLSTLDPEERMDALVRLRRAGAYAGPLHRPEPRCANARAAWWDLVAPVANEAQVRARRLVAIRSATAEVDPPRYWWHEPPTTRGGAAASQTDWLAVTLDQLAGAAGCLELARLIAVRMAGRTTSYTRYGACIGLDSMVLSGPLLVSAPNPRLTAGEPWVLPAGHDARADSRCVVGRNWAWVQTMSGYQVLLDSNCPDRVLADFRRARAQGGGKSAGFRDQLERRAKAAGLHVQEWEPGWRHPSDTLELMGFPRAEV